MRRIAAVLALLFFASSALAEVPVSPEFKAAESAALDLSNRAQDLRKQAADDFAASPARNAEGCKGLRDANALLLQIHPLAERMIAELEYRKAANIDTYKSFLITTQYTIDNGTAGISSCGEFDPGWTLTPDVTHMRALSALHLAATSKIRGLTEASDDAVICPLTEELLAVAQAETVLIPAYLAAHGTQDTAMSDRQKWRDNVTNARTAGSDVWYTHCSGKTEPATYSDWDSADRGFQSELQSYLSAANQASGPMNDPAKYDQACAPLRKSMAILTLLQRRIVHLKSLAAGDNQHENRAQDYDTAIATAVQNFAGDAEACADGFYARPLYVRNIQAGAVDFHDNYVLIPASLEFTLESREKDRQAMDDKVLDGKAIWQRDYDGGNDLAICGDQAYVKDVVGQEIDIYHRMADDAAAYPRVADGFNKAADSLFERYDTFFNSCF